MLDIQQRAAIQAALGYLLDEDHASAAPGWLEEKTGCTADELRAASFELAHPQTMLADGPDSGLIAAARALNENLPDSLPLSDDICSRADVQEQLQTVREHERALENELARDALRTKRGWLVPAPWDGPELALEPELGTEPSVPSRARSLWVLQELARLVETEPESLPDESESMLARVMLATGALYARGAGTLSQCMRTASLWERG